MKNASVYYGEKFVRELEPFEVFLAKRDIAGFYSKQSEEYSLYGDADFGVVLSLPYWDYLNIRNIDLIDAEEIRTGSLVILTAMALEPFENLGTYYLSDKEKYEKVSTALKSFVPNNPDEERLKKLIFELLDSSDHTSNGHLENDIQWVYIKFIYGHFFRKLSSFGNQIEMLYTKLTTVDSQS